MEKSSHLTENEIRKALAPKQGQRFLWDDEVKGFALRITFTGAKAFIFDYRFQGRQRRMTIGSFPVWSLTAARKSASETKRDVDRGIDPMGERHNLRTAPTVNDLWERYKDEHLNKKSPRSQTDETGMWNNIILPRLGKHKVMLVTQEDIDKLHRDITEVRKTPVRANRTIEVLRKAFNLAKRWKWIVENPVVGVRRNPEEKRNRYLNKQEIAALALALNEHHDRAVANAIKLLMLTGARKSEVTGATWDMFDLENGIWTKPSAHTKQRKLHRVPLSSPALNLLLGIKSQAEADFEKARRKDKDAKKSAYVFPSSVAKDKPIQEIRDTWVEVCTAAGLTDKIEKKNRQGKVVKDEEGQPVMIDWPNVRIHDLRHSFASILVSSGASLPLIGQMLGHTQVQTTQRYAHLYDDPLRKAAEMVGQVIMPALAQIEGPGKAEKKTAKKRKVA